MEIKSNLLENVAGRIINRLYAGTRKNFKRYS